ncbi:MAG TPA: SCO family protein [Gaiellaceae bacterium]|nr:SCO family protein [Gaiellaceae bacterium]
MSGSPSSKRFPWLKIALVGVAVAAGTGVGIGVAIAQGSGNGATGTTTIPADPGITFAAGKRPAPNFMLRDQAGRTISMQSLRGRTVVLAFIDPVCRNLCPGEARVLDGVANGLPRSQRPAIVAVSVNPWGQAASNLRLDASRWKLVPEWRWALGDFRSLQKVWDSYAISVLVHTKTLAGVTVREVDHTEAAYVIDPSGHERALFIYPYRSADVIGAVRRVS